MRAEINHRTLEARISHHGQRDQPLTVEVTAIGRIVANAGGFAANNPRSFAFRVHPQRTLILMHILILGGGSVNQSFLPCSESHHKQFNGLRPRLPIKTSHDRHSSHACRARLCRNYMCVIPGDRGSRPGSAPVATGCTLRRPPAAGAPAPPVPPPRHPPSPP